MSAKSPNLNEIAARRLVPYGLWTAGVIAAAIALYVRAPGEEVVASKDLSTDHQISADDLRTKATDALVGHFLTRSVKAGEPVTPALVTIGKPPPSRANALAAIVTMSAKVRDERKLGVSSHVQLVKAGKQIGPPGIITTIDCDRGTCRAMVAFARGTIVSISPEDLAAADLIPTTPAKTP